MIATGLIILAMAAANIDAGKIVSLDYCADQYVLALADRERIAAVSRDAEKEFSHLRRDAAGVPRIRANREEVFALSPDLIIRQWGGAPALTKALSADGATIVNLGFPTSYDDIIDNIELAARALDADMRGAAIIDDMERRLSAINPPKEKIRALYVTPGGVTAGRHTLIDAAMKAAGVENVAGDKSFWPPLSIEDLMLAPPDLIIAGFVETADDRVNHWSASRHDALRSVFDETPTIFIEQSLLACDAWFSVKIAEEIARAAGTLDAAQTP